MTNELIALVAVLSNDGLPEQYPDSGSAIELNYSNVNPDAYRRAIDVLDGLGLLTSDAVEKCQVGESSLFYELVRIGQLKLFSPADLCYASGKLAGYAEQEPAPIEALASLTPVEGPTPLRPVTTKVRHLTALPAFYSGDPGDEDSAA